MPRPAPHALFPAAPTQARPAPRGRWTPLLDDYTTFHAVQLDNRDYDPLYPVLARVASVQGWSVEQTLWACMVFVAWYDLGSALAVLARHPDPAVPAVDLLRLPCATERRGHRDVRNLTRHLASVVEAANAHGGLVPWLSSALAATPSGRSLYPAGFAHLQTLYGNGRWAAYKTCELLAFVLPHAASPPAAFDAARLLPTDMGHAHSTGPRKGLALLRTELPPGDSADAVAEMDALSGELLAHLDRRGVVAPVSVAETTLCDFHALHAGRYYPGHDIDQMQDQLTRTRSELTAVAFAARASTLPTRYLGELGGWSGVDRDRRALYARTGRIPERP